MNSGHTPGPWTDAGPGKDGRTPWYIRGPVGYRNAPQPAVATVPSCLPRSECAANARLIAAAPKLYEACQTLICTYELVDPDPMQWPDLHLAYNKAKLALKAANVEYTTED